MRTPSPFLLILPQNIETLTVKWSCSLFLLFSIRWLLVMIISAVAVAICHLPTVQLCQMCRCLAVFILSFNQAGPVHCTQTHMHNFALCVDARKTTTTTTSATLTMLHTKRYMHRKWTKRRKVKMGKRENTCRFECPFQRQWQHL